MSIKFDRGPDPLAKLPALAYRLGVKQIVSDRPSSLVITTREGQKYDVFELINAVLDRLERI